MNSMNFMEAFTKCAVGIAMRFQFSEDLEYTLYVCPRLDTIRELVTDGSYTQCRIAASVYLKKLRDQGLKMSICDRGWQWQTLGMSVHIECTTPAPVMEDWGLYEEDAEDDFAEMFASL